MNEKKTGGPAFPQPMVTVEREIISAADYGEGGITMRDYFAAKALPAVIAEWCEWCKSEDGDGIGNEFIPENIQLMAIDSYEIADAMLKARAA